MTPRGGRNLIHPDRERRLQALPDWTWEPVRRRVGGGVCFARFSGDFRTRLILQALRKKVCSGSEQEVSGRAA